MVAIRADEADYLGGVSSSSWLGGGGLSPRRETSRDQVSVSPWAWMALGEGPYPYFLHAHERGGSP